MIDSASPSVAAVIAAAGLSRRMGTPKQLLRWGNRTVLATVVANLIEAGAKPAVCVVGHQGDTIRSALHQTPVQVLDNPDYLQGEMIHSYKVGVASLMPQKGTSGTLLTPGDQPHVAPSIIRQVVDTARRYPEQIVIPSYAMRRGHPFYLPRRLWPALLNLQGHTTLRQLISQPSEEIIYVNVESDSILRDMDTPEDYETLRRQYAATPENRLHTL